MERPAPASPLENMLVVPRPEQPLRIWLGTGGSPESVLRAVELGVRMFLGILGGTPEHWAQYGRAYREAWATGRPPPDDADVAVAVHGFVARNRPRSQGHLPRTRAPHVPDRLGRDRPSDAGARRPRGDVERGMVFAGGPDEIAERILHLHELLGHSRQILQMDVGGMPQATFLKAIELLGTKVLPQIRKELESG